MAINFCSTEMRPLGTFWGNSLFLFQLAPTTKSEKQSVWEIYILYLSTQSYFKIHSKASSKSFSISSLTFWENSLFLFQLAPTTKSEKQSV